MGVGFALLFLLIALMASCALGAGTAYLVVRKSKQPILWALAPVFALLWMMIGAVPLGMFGWQATVVPAPVPVPAPAPVQIAPADDAVTR